MARDAGKRKEKDLYAMWGGMPSVRFLRHCDGKNPVTLGRYHAKLAKLIEGLKIPSQEEVQDSPEAADVVYDTCTKYLLEATRDRKKFELLFERELQLRVSQKPLAMKAQGITLAAICLILSLALLTIRSVKHSPITPITAICGVINLVLLFTWIFWIRPE